MAPRVIIGLTCLCVVLSACAWAEDAAKPAPAADEAETIKKEIATLRARLTELENRLAQLRSVKPEPVLVADLIKRAQEDREQRLAAAAAKVRDLEARARKREPVTTQLAEAKAWQAQEKARMTLRVPYMTEVVEGAAGRLPGIQLRSGNVTVGCLIVRQILGPDEARCDRVTGYEAVAKGGLSTDEASSFQAVILRGRETRGWKVGRYLQDDEAYVVQGSREVTIDEAAVQAPILQRLDLSSVKEFATPAATP